mmetsp:Transcript_5352/g.9830  ORF Transcript_5352/g.9830 Transcript_5352/m.9830 type:complete len:125 (-) Transcript_5352:651-1025(-)
MATHHRSVTELPRNKLCETPPHLPYLTRLVSEKPQRVSTKPVFNIDRYYSSPNFEGVNPPSRRLSTGSLRTMSVVMRTKSCTPPSPLSVEKLPRVTSMGPIGRLIECYALKPKFVRRLKRSLLR